MKSSIRKFLLINLLIALTITTTVTAIGNYFLDRKDIQEHLDILMAMSTLSYQALIGDDLHQRHIQKLQNNLNEVPQQMYSYFKNQSAYAEYINKFNFQVWTFDNRILLQSQSQSLIPLNTDMQGFQDLTINDQKWRVFSAHNNDAEIKTILGEQYTTRNELGKKITKDDLLIMLLTFPLTGFLIWLIISRGLQSLEKVASEVANRAPSHLEPVNIKEVPDEIRPLVDELNNLFFRLKQGFEREKRFAADAAHELRTPLAALKTQAQVALNTDDINEKNKALQKLIASVNRSAHVVQQLLTMSRLVPESFDITQEADVNLTTVAREVLAMLATTAIEKNIELEFESEDVPSIKGNATALSIMIRNLVDNAIRYCRENDKVIVKIYPDNGHVVLEVSDTGPGIPVEFKGRVFERFFRVLGTKASGSGLGLAIVKQICDLHNAEITLENYADTTGLSFKIYFDKSLDDNGYLP